MEPLSHHIAEIQPTRLYTRGEVAAWLRLSESEVSRIPAEELPRRYVGSARGSLRYYEIDVICYISGIDPVDWGALRDHVLQRFASAIPSVRPMPTGKQRVL